MRGVLFELLVGALVSAACSSSPAPDPLAPSIGSSASSSAVVPSASVSSSVELLSPSASASSAASSAEQRECFCAKWEQGTEKREICADDLRACMRRRLLDEKVHRAECLPIRKDECVGTGCKGEKCYRLKPGGATPPP